VSALPAPDTAAEQPAPPPGPAAPSAPSADPAPQGPGATTTPIIPLPGPIAPTGGDDLSDATGQIGGTLGSVSPALGQAVSQTGSRLDATVTGVLGAR
jgi:hypothetical protein